MLQQGGADRHADEPAARKGHSLGQRTPRQIEGRACRWPADGSTAPPEAPP